MDELVMAKEDMDKEGQLVLLIASEEGYNMTPRPQEAVRTWLHERGWRMVPMGAHIPPGTMYIRPDVERGWVLSKVTLPWVHAETGCTIFAVRETA